MILTEESRIFPLKQPGLGGGSEMLQSAARGGMEKLVQTCLRDLDWGWGEFGMMGHLTTVTFGSALE